MAGELSTRRKHGCLPARNYPGRSVLHNNICQVVHPFFHFIYLSKIIYPYITHLSFPNIHSLIHRFIHHCSYSLLFFYSFIYLFFDPSILSVFFLFFYLPFLFLYSLIQSCICVGFFILYPYKVTHLSAIKKKYSYSLIYHSWNVFIHYHTH